MKTITFELSLTFSEKIKSDAEILEIGTHILDALVHEIDHGMGLAPENNAAYTEKIIVREPLTGIQMNHNFDI